MNQSLESQSVNHRDRKVEIEDLIRYEADSEILELEQNKKVEKFEQSFVTCSYKFKRASSEQMLSSMAAT